jgi:hypothetical protein
VDQISATDFRWRHARLAANRGSRLLGTRFRFRRRSSRPPVDRLPAIRLQQIRLGVSGALAIQRAENPKGACEIYHYNSDGTLDWGYFQINTVHLTRAGLNLRGLLDCRANIDFAYQLYQERGFQPWSTYNDGAYRRFLQNP